MGFVLFDPANNDGCGLGRRQRLGSGHRLGSAIGFRNGRTFQSGVCANVRRNGAWTYNGVLEAKNFSNAIARVLVTPDTYDSIDFMLVKFRIPLSPPEIFVSYSF